MARLPENPACSLSGTNYCRLLNMRDCEKCTMRNSDELDRVKKDIDVYETLLPEGGVARLFQSRECQFCKGEPRGERAGYAILDMAHPEPKRVQKFLWGKRTLEIGTMIPVQMSVCRACRRRFLLMDYLPTAVPVVLGAAGLLLATTGPLSDALARWSPIGPFALWLLIILLGWGLGKWLSAWVRRKNGSRMLTDVTAHPVVAEMIQKGWRPVTRRSVSRLLFSATRMNRGLGTAPDEPELPENAEKD